MGEKTKELIIQEINEELYMDTSEVTIKNLIYVIRGQQVMLDSDLAELIAKAKTEIVLIDNYVDVGTLNILAKKQENVKAQIYTVKRTKLSLTDIMTGMKASKKWQ